MVKPWEAKDDAVFPEVRKEEPLYAFVLPPRDEQVAVACYSSAEVLCSIYVVEESGLLELSGSEVQPFGRSLVDEVVRSATVDKGALGSLPMYGRER